MKKIIILLMLFIFNCGNSNENYQKEYDTRVLLVFLTTPDPEKECVTSMQKALDCLKSATSSPAPIINETTLSLIFSGNKQNTYTNYCTATLASDTYKNTSKAGKECIMKCNTNYWQDRTNRNICTDSFTSQLNGMADGTKLCTANCFKLNNTTP